MAERARLLHSMRARLGPTRLCLEPELPWVWLDHRCPTPSRCWTLDLGRPRPRAPLALFVAVFAGWALARGEAAAAVGSLVTCARAAIVLDKPGARLRVGATLAAAGAVVALTAGDVMRRLLLLPVSIAVATELPCWRRLWQPGNLRRRVLTLASLDGLRLVLLLLAAAVMADGLLDTGWRRTAFPLAIGVAAATLSTIARRRLAQGPLVALVASGSSAWSSDGLTVPLLMLGAIVAAWPPLTAGGERGANGES
jgi:hypothetical protein